MKKLTFILILTLVSLGMAAPLAADDTDIYGGGSVSVEPNVLIIFDTSGSMDTKDVPGAYYDPATIYAGRHPANKVYRLEDGEDWEWFANDIADLNCPSVSDALRANGTAEGRIRYRRSGYTCGGSKKELYTGNWRNYDETVGSTRKRVDVAKEVITNLIRDTNGVRFGLMRFNHNKGGRVIKPIGSVTRNEAYRTELINAVNALPTDCWTPLGETLAEAGLYFAGKKSWFNDASDYSDDVLTTSNTYTSPMQYRCQKNYIILMTDGEPTKDSDAKLKSGTYINGDKIGDYDRDRKERDEDSMDYLDDVAKYLQDNDCNPSLGTGDPSFETQRITTYTIGFRSAQALLQETAVNGGGDYYVANSISGLAQAFQDIISRITETNAVFVAPMVPVNSMNRAYSGNDMYVGFFKPQASGRWAGNVKKYMLTNKGAILDANGVAATHSNGHIKENAKSYWSRETDGPDVTKGGLGSLLLDNTTRKLYTNLSPSEKNLTAGSNAFATANSLLDAATLGVSATQRDTIIKDIIGNDLDWKMGDVLHSPPTVVHYGADSYIFVGTNGGMMHAFKNSDGSEMWGFIPKPHLSRLKNLSDSNTTHDYFVDGVPVVYDNGTTKTLFFGERRGGYDYYALDVTDPATPKYKYDVKPNILGAGASLGQSWSVPTVHKIKTGTSSKEVVLLMSGGYDPNHDLPTTDPGYTTTDTMGKAVFTINVDNGVLSNLNFNAGNFSTMSHCIVDTMGFDSVGDGYTNRVYAGDLGGNIWAFEDDDPDLTDSSYGGDGVWKGRKLIAGGSNRKIFYAPDAVPVKGGEMIYFGTGDRANPEKTSVTNRIYAVRNNWSASTENLNDTNLIDVTANLIQDGTDTQKDDYRTRLTDENSPGWYFDLEHPGEKIISRVVVFAGVLYFTSYTPESGAAAPAADPCTTAGGRGVARLYAVDYLTGAAVKNFTTANDSGDEEHLGKADRYVKIGTSIASSPTIAILPDGARVITGKEGGMDSRRAIENNSVHVLYWRQIPN